MMLGLSELSHHKAELKRLMLKYRQFLINLNCGYELANYIFSEPKQLETLMDEHIKAINRLDNKSFKTFAEGYVPSWRFN